MTRFFTKRADLYSRSIDDQTRHKDESYLLAYADVPCERFWKNRTQVENNAYDDVDGAYMDMVYFMFHGGQEVKIGWEVEFEGERYKVESIFDAESVAGDTYKKVACNIINGNSD